MVLEYNTTCNQAECTTNYTVDDKGFVDPNYLIAWANADNEGPNAELFGTTYDYEKVTWTEKYDNPGYKFDKSGKPLSIKQNKQKNEK